MQRLTARPQLDKAKRRGKYSTQLKPLNTSHHNSYDKPIFILRRIFFSSPNHHFLSFTNVYFGETISYNAPKACKTHLRIRRNKEKQKGWLIGMEDQPQECHLTSSKKHRANFISTLIRPRQKNGEKIKILSTKCHVGEINYVT